MLFLLPVIASAADGDFATGATLKVTWIQTAIVVLVPALIAALKKFWPSVPKPLLPFLCPALGWAAGYVGGLAGMDIGSPEASAALGGLGLFLREVFDQSKNGLFDIPSSKP